MLPWQSRLRAQITLVAPDGTRFVASWGGDDIEIGKQVPQFNPPLFDGTITQGRLRTDVDPETHIPPDSRNGDYWNDGGVWVAWCPTEQEKVLLCSLSKHSVTVHEDGTITVSPSILCGPRYDGIVWHGFLERGIWREV